MMMRRFVAYVPDLLWSEFLNGHIDHFEYDSPLRGRSVAIWADGRREEFDSEVTPDREAAYREQELQWFKQHGGLVLWEGRLEIDSPKYHRRLVSFT